MESLPMLSEKESRTMHQQALVSASSSSAFVAWELATCRNLCLAVRPRAAAPLPTTAHDHDHRDPLMSGGSTLISPSTMQLPFPYAL